MHVLGRLYEGGESQEPVPNLGWWSMNSEVVNEDSCWFGTVNGDLRFS